MHLVNSCFIIFDSKLKAMFNLRITVIGFKNIYLFLRSC